jgi:hypothetical protein
MDNKEPVSLNSNIQKSRTGLYNALRELPDDVWPANSEAGLCLSEPAPHGLAHQVVESYDTRLESRGVQVCQVVTDCINRGCVRV